MFLEVDQQLVERDLALAELRQHLHRAQQCMKTQEDRKRCDVSFEVDDMVFLKLKPYRHFSVAHKSNEKLPLVFMDLLRL